MPHNLSEFLKQRAEQHLRYILKEANAVSEEEAFRYASSHWLGHKYGVGQNGSIAGIVYHVAAWKTLSLPLFQGEQGMREVEDFNASEAPSPDDWDGIKAWLERVGTEWNSALACVLEEDLDSMRPWGTRKIPLSEFVIEMIEHDVQHASQIEYLRQRLALESEIPCSP